MNLFPKIKPFLHGVARDFWPKRPWERVLLVTSILFCLITILAAYGGIVRPGDGFFREMLPGLVMAFPLLLYILIAALGVSLFMWRRGARVLFVTLLAILAAAYIIIPLHFANFIADKDARERSFTLLTYNVMAMLDFEGPFQPGVPNRTLQFVLDNNPDIVCLQEIYREAESNVLNITTGQRNLRDLRYPWQLLWHESAVGIYSKFPMKEILIGDDPRMPWAHYKAARVYLMDDSITVINCHLQSIGLDANDKNVYHSLSSARWDVDSVGDISERIADKLNDAFVARAIQAEWIRKAVDSIGGNVIVCGDFNDVPLSYATRTVKGSDLQDAFTQTSLGPRISYHDNRFYFRIDHVFYRGNFSAYNTRIPSQPSSDHYPYLAKFIFHEEKDKAPEQ